MNKYRSINPYFPLPDEGEGVPRNAGRVRELSVFPPSVQRERVDSPQAIRKRRVGR
ncbi:MAG: hypothetical protein GF315_09060 [candidate division Zixibacteria bacterium]|nr:hypothetical protein [candidate division Zixibacteria bacterium]